MICSTGEVLVWMKRAAAIDDADVALLEMLHVPAERALKDELDNDLEYALHTEYLPLGGSGAGQVTLADYDMINGRVVPAARYSRSDRLQLKHTPVWLDDSLKVYEDVGAYAGQGGTPFAADTLLTRGTDYYLDVGEGRTSEYSESGQLIKTSGTWPTEARAIKVEYYGGWTEAQFDDQAGTVKLAAIMTVAKAVWEAKALSKSGGAGAVQSESIGKYSASYASMGAANTGLVIAIPAEALALVQKQRNYGVLM